MNEFDDKVRKYMEARREREGRKLSSGDMNLLRLVQQSAGAEGWAKVSKQVCPVIAALPSALIDFKRNDDGSGWARLTYVGQVAVDWA